MKTLKLIHLIPVAILFVGCAHGKKKNVSYLKEIETRTLTSQTASASCRFGEPQKKLAWQRILSIANRCWRDKNWSELKEAAAFLRQSYAEAPWGFFYQSVIDEQAGQNTSALWMIQRALELAPDQDLLLYQKARLLWRMEENSEAVKLLRQTLKANPRLVPAYSFIAQLMWAEGNQKAAVEQLEAALKIEPGNRELQELYARYTSDGKSKVARGEKRSKQEGE